MSFDPVSYAMGKQAGGGGGVTVEPLTVTENGVYTAPSGKAYSPVSVEVPIPELEVPQKWTRPADWPNLDLINVSQPRDEITAYITIFCDGTWQWLDGKNAFYTAAEIELDESGNETIIQTLQYNSGGGYMFDISPLSNGIHLIKMLAHSDSMYLSRSVLENVQQKTLESIIIGARNFGIITLNAGDQRDWLPGVSVSCRHLAVYWLTADTLESTSCLFGFAPALEKVEFYHCEFSQGLLSYSLRYNTQLVELSFSECEYTPSAYSSPHPFAAFNLETWIMPASWDWSVLTDAETVINKNCYMLKNFSGLKNAAINQNYTNCIHLTVQSLMNIINGLPTVSTVKTLTLGATNKAKLTPEQIAVATQKGWTVA